MQLKLHLVLRIEELGVLDALLFAENLEDGDGTLSFARADAVGQLHTVGMRVSGQQSVRLGQLAEGVLVVRRVHRALPFALAHEADDRFVLARHAEVHPCENENHDADDGRREDREDVLMRSHAQTDRENKEDVRHVLRIFDGGAEPDERECAEKTDRGDEAAACDHHDHGTKHAEEDQRELE